jgi:RNA polymerase sigma-70 factor (ECF subfamily)
VIPARAKSAEAMSASDPSRDSVNRAAARFTTTHWSVIARAGRSDSPEAQAALAELCQTYWYPLYAFIRHCGYGAEDAQDLTQEFFVRFLAKRFHAAARPERGRFRSFLLMTLKRFLANQTRRARAQKRGGGQPVFSIDQGLAESRYTAEPAHRFSADVLFERRWARTLLEQVLARLEAEYGAGEKKRLFECLKDCLTRESSALPYATIAAQAGMTEAAVKVAAHRIRARYRELLRDGIAKTVSGPDEVEEEIRHLFATFGT